jgi:hypothetical protein
MVERRIVERGIKRKNDKRRTYSIRRDMGETIHGGILQGGIKSRRENRSNNRIERERINKGEG